MNASEATTVAWNLTSALTTEGSDIRSLSTPEISAVFLWKYAGTVLLFASLVGNLSVLSLGLLKPHLRRRSITVFIALSAVAALGTTTVGMLNKLVYHFSYYRFDLRDFMTDAGCRVHAMMTYIWLQTYAWMQAAVSVERLVCAECPHLYRKWSSRRLNLLVAGVVFGCLVAANGIVARSYGLDAVGRCVPADHSALFEHVWRYVDVALTFAGPLLIIASCSCRTVVLMHRVKSSRVGRRLSPITRTLLASNVVFVCSMFPDALLIVLANPDLHRTSDSLVSTLSSASNLVLYAGCGCSFIVYFVGMSSFRKALLKMVRRTRRAPSFIETCASQRSTSLSPGNMKTTTFTSTSSDWECSRALNSEVADQAAEQNEVAGAHYENTSN